VNDNKNPTPEADSLQPTSATARVFSLGSYVLMWWSSLIVVQAFALGQGFLPPVGRLNLTQAIVVMVVAAVASIVMFSLNGEPGLRYGIPYSIQSRTSFGVRGSKFAELLRAVPAIIWCGIGTWIGVTWSTVIDQALATTPWASRCLPVKTS